MLSLINNSILSSFFFFFNDTATTEIYTLSLHDALPISTRPGTRERPCANANAAPHGPRSEEHTSELQSRADLVCRLLLEKKKTHEFGNHRLQVQATSTFNVFYISAF